jgi:phosphoenolpyruvate carboxykinase (GTP)
MGSIVGSEVTAAAIGLKAGVRRDPFAMLPFCGYHMGDYFAHWVGIGEAAPDKTKLPKIFNVNWFRKSAQGKFLWPGYGENIRVLQWIFERTAGTITAIETPIGFVPELGSINTEGLDGVEENMIELLAVDKGQWKDELDLVREQYAAFGTHLPQELVEEITAIEARFGI